MTVKGTIFATLVICIILLDRTCASFMDQQEGKRSSGKELLKRAIVQSIYKPWLTRSSGKELLKRAIVPSFYKPSLTRRDRRYHYMHMTDAGYGSRLFISSWLGRALIAQRNIFGVSGPGKKK